MERLKNEQGYALIIVLFLVVFIMLVFAVFIRGSISNAKQEQIVDQNHLSVVAAEMGVDYYVSKVKNEERIILKNTLDYIKNDIETFIRCDGIENSNDTSCKTVKSINTINEEAENKYLDDLKDIIGSIKETPSHKDQIIPEDPSYFYQLYANKEKWGENRLDQWDKVWKEVNDEITISLEVTGESKQKSFKELQAEIIFEIPNFVSGKPNTNGSSSEVFEYFNKNGEYSNDYACNEQGNKCEEGKFYSTGDRNLKNPNNKGAIVWVHNGYLKVNQANSMNSDFNLIVGSISIEGTNGMEGKLVLLGNENDKKEMDSLGIKFKDSGKICINLDGFSSNNLNNNNFEMQGNTNDRVLKDHIHFYSSSSKFVWPSLKYEYTKHDQGSLADFVNSCVGGSPLIEQDWKIKTNDKVTDMKVDVSY